MAKSLLLRLLFTILLTCGVTSFSPLAVRDEPEAVPAFEDLAFIPANAQGFLSVRVADLWTTPAVQKGRADAKERDPKHSDPAKVMEKAFGLQPIQVERVSVVYSADGLAWGIVRTRKPVDQKKLLSRLDGVKQGKQYHTGTDKQGRAVAVWFASPSVVIIGAEDGVKACIALAAKPIPKGPLEPIIALCKGEHHAVVGIDGKKLDGVKGNLLLSWVTPIQLAWATVDVDKEVELSIHARAADEKQAKRVERNVGVAVRLTPEYLGAKIDVDVASALGL